MEPLKKRRYNLEMQRLAERRNHQQASPAKDSSLWAESDFSTERLLEHMETNPIGKLLKIIATLPDVRYDKIEKARQQLSLSEEALDERLNLALDRVFEELGTEG